MIHENYGHEWAQEMARLLVEIKREVETLNSHDPECISPDNIHSYMQKYDNIIGKRKL